MSFVSNILIDSIEEIILDDISIIDSFQFRQFQTPSILDENIYKYLDYIVLKRRSLSNSYILYQEEPRPYYQPLSLQSNYVGDDYV